MEISNLKWSYIIDCFTALLSSAEQLRTRLFQVANHIVSPSVQSQEIPVDVDGQTTTKIPEVTKITKDQMQVFAMNLEARKQTFEQNIKVNDCALCRISFDMIIGFIAFLILKYFMSPDKMTEFIVSWRDETRSFLAQLIEWLMGAPAGLKLNHEMTFFLGNFFQYHIYIWIGYLSLIEPYLKIIIHIIISSGCLGLSFMLSLTEDAVNILTFHTFCFYVYASKVYNLQLKALVSLSRLFRGDCYFL
eukprot:gene7731-8571_t